MLLGNRKELQVEDLYKIVPGDESETLGMRLERYFQEKISKF